MQVPIRKAIENHLQDINPWSEVARTLVEISHYMVCQLHNRVSAEIYDYGVLFCYCRQPLFDIVYYRGFQQHVQFYANA